MMRQLLNLVFLFILSIGLQAQSPEIIWGGPNDPNGSFDGGLNDWTTVGVECADPDSVENAVWWWDAEGDASEGAYWGTRDPIQSETNDNGAAVFNSDYLDNLGIQGNFGAGPAPSPHRGELISPSIDCSNYNSVAMTFTQYYRNFDSQVLVAASNDGGNTWTEYSLNEGIATNSSTAPDSRIQVDISEVAAGEANVQIKFIFDGDYYFWIVDDVALQTLPANDMVAEYSFYPLSNFRTPAKLVDCDTLGFSMGIKNNGGVTQTGVEIHARIEDETGVEQFSATESVGTVDPGEVDTFDFQQLFVPDNLSAGLYTIEYEVTSDSTDFFPDDNIMTHQFILTDSLYSKDINGHQTGFRSSSPPETWSVANLYQTCPYDAKMGDIFTRLFWSFSADEMDFPTLEGETVDLWVAEIDPDVCANLDNFTTDMTDPFNHPDLTITGFNTYELNDNTPQSTLLDSVLYDYQYLQDEGMLRLGAPIKSDACYLAGVTADGLLFLGFEQQLDYAPNLVSTIVVTSQWFLGGFQGGPDATVRAEVDFATSTDYPTLPEAAVSLYPNPVEDQLTLDFDLESSQDVNVFVTDVMGRTVQTHQLTDVINDNWTTQIQNVQAGTYFLRVVAEEGERTIKFIKQ